MLAHDDTAHAAIWAALADPTRRHILDLLRVRPMTTGQIADRFPMSRIAVMKHLTTLVETGLVVSRKRGRERWHYVNLVPLHRVYERWSRPLDRQWAARLVRLSRQIEASDAPMSSRAPEPWPLSIDIQQDVTIRAPRERVFDALTRDVGAWWGPPYVNDAATDIVLEPRLGGWFHEVWRGDGGALLAIVTAIEPGVRLELTGRLHMGVVHGVVDFQLEETVDNTIVHFSHRAIGPVDPDAVTWFAEGWTALLDHRLRAFLERGERLGFGAAS